jgi:predicted site-specific integrase-resolvase
MNEGVFTPKELSKLLHVSVETLKYWENNGKIKASKTQGGHRRYHYSFPSQDQSNKKQYIYARVSSSKQKHDLQRQVDALQKAHPTFEVVQDIGSGINFKRRGLLTLLDQTIAGNVSQVVVAHRDRLARFGFELFQHLFQRFGVTLTVLSDPDIKEPARELATDLLSIITVFTARYYGSRGYKVLQKNKVLSNPRAAPFLKPVLRRSKVLLQQSSSHPQRKRSQGNLIASKAAPLGHEER